MPRKFNGLTDVEWNFLSRKSCGKKSEHEEFSQKFQEENGQKENSPEEEKSASLKTDGKWKETSHGFKENSEDCD